MARPCLALLRNMKHSHIVVDKAVRNFDMVSYHRGKIERFFLLFFRSGGEDLCPQLYLQSTQTLLCKEGLWQVYHLLTYGDYVIR